MMRAAPFALAAALALPHAAFATVATLVQAAQVSADNPDTGPIVTLPGFDPSLGELLGVTLRYSGDARITSDIRNYPGNVAPVTLVPVIGIEAGDSGFRFSTAPVILPAQSGPVEAGFAFDQTESLPLLPSGPVSLSSWIVADVTCGDCVADGFGVVGGQATLTMTYNDPPAAVTEPSSFSLLAWWGVAFLGLSWLAGSTAFAGPPTRVRDNGCLG